ncbi:MAG: hypothetical protein GX147_01265 [Deltaproteobacteria bacterium]|nr:hypothetical protein [Deltaproteobacteria bacterium]
MTHHKGDIQADCDPDDMSVSHSYADTFHGGWNALHRINCRHRCWHRGGCDQEFFSVVTVKGA